MSVRVRWEDDPRCERCTGPVTVQVRLPRQLDRSGGHDAMGVCPACDRDDPDAQGLLAFFAVHETISDDQFPTVARLIEEWTTRTVAGAGARGEAARADYEDYLRWSAGEF